MRLLKTLGSLSPFLTLVLLISPTTAAALELIENGSFEVDARHIDPLMTGWDDGPNRGNDVGLLTVQYPFFFGNGENSGWATFELPEIPQEGFVRPKGAGEYFGLRWGVWNGTGFLGSASQIIDLTSHSGKPFTFGAWLASRDTSADTDYAIVSIEYFSGPTGSGNSLGSIIFDGNDSISQFIVGSMNVDGLADATIPANQDNWSYYEARGVIPLTAVSAIAMIRGATITGPGAEGGYVDLISLQVVPEPSSAILLGGGLVSLLLVWRRVGRGLSLAAGTTPAGCLDG